MPLRTTAKGNMTAWPVARGLLGAAAGLGAAKANTLPALPQFSPVFQINRCLSQRALWPRSPDQAIAALLFLTWPVSYSAAASSPWSSRRPRLGLHAGPAPGPTPPWAPLAGGQAEHSNRLGQGELGETMCPSELHAVSLWIKAPLQLGR